MSTLDGQERVGFDLDRTLAVFKANPGDEYFPEKIGRPIPSMVELAKRHMERGDTVVIFTARVWPGYTPERQEEARVALKAIQEWCVEVFGTILEVTCMKDPKMHRIYDDRAVTVEPNIGNIMTIGFQEVEGEDQPDSLGELIGK